MAFLGNHSAQTSAVGTLQGNEWTLAVTITVPYTITALGCYTDLGAGGSHCIMGLYDSSGANPNNLLGSTGTFALSGVGADTETKVTLGTAIVISPGTYHIAFLTDDGTLTLGYGAGGPVFGKRKAATYPTLMSPWTVAGTVNNTFGMSLFAEGTAGLNPGGLGGGGIGKGPPGGGPGRGGGGGPGPTGPNVRANIAGFLRSKDAWTGGEG